MTNEQLTARESPIRVGDTAPDFTLPDQDRKDTTLSELLMKGDVVLSFFPMAFTGVCTQEMGCYTRDLNAFRHKGAEVVGVSCDSFAALKAWAEKEGIKTPLLADMHRRVCRAYGLYFAPLNVAARGTVVIKGGEGPDRGKVLWVSARELKDAVNNKDVLAAIS